MRRSVVKTGLKLVSAAVALVISAAFFHEYVASLFFLSPGGETQFIFLGLFWGGLFGFSGIAVMIVGLLRSPGGEQGVGLLKPLVILVALVLFFLCLLLSSFSGPERPQLRPGEMITI